MRVTNGVVNVAVLGPGQLFGTSALFGAALTTQRVVALDDVVICEAPAAQFLAANGDASPSRGESRDAEAWRGVRATRMTSA